MALRITWVQAEVPRLTVVFPDDIDPMIGRDPDTNDLVLHHVTVSRRHARLSQKEGAVYVADLGSTAGTWVNEARISDPVKLREDDLVTIGVCQLRIRHTTTGATRFDAEETDLV